MVDALASCALDECNDYDFNNPNAGCCAPPGRCTSYTTGVCAAGTVIDPSATCATPNCADSDFGNQNSNCCTLPASCNTDTSRTCVAPAVEYDTGACAGAVCADVDFGGVDTACCTAPALCSSTNSWSCVGPAVKINTATCGAVTCQATDFGYGETTCCDTPCSVDTSRYCANGAVEDPAGYCAGRDCQDSDFGNMFTNCCDTPASCSTDTTHACSGGSVDDDAGLCATLICTAADFGYASTACCKASAPVNVVLSLATDIASIPTGTNARATFEHNFRVDVARNLGVGSSRITIVGITAGSVNVEFQVLPDVNGGAMATATIVNAFRQPGVSIAGSTTTEGITAQHLAQATPPAPPLDDGRATRRQPGQEGPNWAYISIGFLVMVAVIVVAIFAAGRERAKVKDTDAVETANPLA